MLAKLQILLEYVVAFSAFVAARIVWRKFVVWKTQDWPEVLGTIESVQVIDTQEEHAVEVAYSYVVNGEYQSGYYKRDVFRLPDSFERMTRGKKVWVHYDPRNPTKSVLWKEAL